jgi:PAS domain S-box-containing protein
MNFSFEHMKALIHEDDRMLFFDRYKSRLAGEAVPTSYELRINRKNGEQRWVQIYSSRILYNNEPAVQASFLDVTAQRQMQHDLQQSERKYRDLVDTALIGVYKSNLSGQFIYVNKAFANILGYGDPKELAETPVEAVYRDIADRSKFLEILNEKSAIERYELRLMAKDGQEKIVLVSAIIEKDVISGTIIDITDRQHMESQLKINLEKYQELMINTIHAMASILETRDPYTAGHQQRVADIVIYIGKAMNLNEDQIKGLHTAAMIHDIGKIYVPAEILSRPSKLTNSEFALIKIHPMVGSDILRKIEFPWPVADIVLHHHERIDGSGYPAGLKDKDILIESKILAVADVIEAMSSHRPYRAALSIEDTIQEIEKNAGILYDKDVVKVTIELIKEKGLLTTL